MLHVFQTGFPSIISTKLHIQWQTFVDRYCYPLLAAYKCLVLYVQFCAADDGRKTRLKHVEHLTEINKFEERCIMLVVL